MRHYRAPKRGSKPTVEFSGHDGPFNIVGHSYKRNGITITFPSDPQPIKRTLSHRKCVECEREFITSEMCDEYTCDGCLSDKQFNNRWETNETNKIKQIIIDLSYDEAGDIAANTTIEFCAETGVKLNESIFSCDDNKIEWRGTLPEPEFKNLQCHICKLRLPFEEMSLVQDGTAKHICGGCNDETN